MQLLHEETMGGGNNIQLTGSLHSVEFSVSDMLSQALSLCLCCFLHYRLLVPSRHPWCSSCCRACRLLLVGLPASIVSVVAVRQPSLMWLCTKTATACLVLSVQRARTASPPRCSLKIASRGPVVGPLA
jgi:hypothetical protein